MPGLLGLTLSAASSTLETRGFSNIPYLYGCYGSTAIDDVVRQVLGPGTQITPTAPVQLYLRGRQLPHRAERHGMNLSNAAYTLKQAGFSNIPYVYGCYGSSSTGDVVSQSPAAGSCYGDTQAVSLRLQANNC